MVALEFLRAYINDFLCITKASLEDHLDTLNMVFNICKLSFCAIKTEYLGSILTSTGIKPQPKEVKAAFAITPPQQVKELRKFLGMVQYYRDLWARCSDMFAPLTALEGECGHIKVTKANKTKNIHGTGIRYIKKHLMM
jgi:hypothetical protein